MKMKLSKGSLQNIIVMIFSYLKYTNFDKLNKKLKNIKTMDKISKTFCD